jgi:CDP-glucose 4,6-dehydratase
MNKEFWKGKRVLVTGHRGFVGSWLWRWLEGCGALVFGLGREKVDVRDRIELGIYINYARPDIIFHLAGQSIVGKALEDPLTTIETNVMGMTNILEIARKTGGRTGLKAVVCATTDMCYEPTQWANGYRETDRLGGDHPYTASKVASEFILHAYVTQYFRNMGIGVAAARSGNVIGVGPNSDARVLAHFMKDIEEDREVEIIYPRASRPWLHVLDSLHGYLLLAERLYSDPYSSDAYNFGPDQGPDKKPQYTLVELVETLIRVMGKGRYKVVESSIFNSVANNYLGLNSSLAFRDLNWRPLWNLYTTILMTAEGKKRIKEKGCTIQCEYRRQIAEFEHTLQIYRDSVTVVADKG